MGCRKKKGRIGLIQTSNLENKIWIILRIFLPEPPIYFFCTSKSSAKSTTTL